MVRDEVSEVTADREKLLAPADLAPGGEAPLFRRVMAEFTGTLLFVAVGTGVFTVLRARPLRQMGQLEELITDPGQIPIFTNLLANRLGDVLPVAFAFAAILALLVYALGGVSGAHFNPAVTFSLASTGRFKWSEVPVYWVAQCVGAIVGALVVAGIYGHGGAEVNGQAVLFGGTRVAPGVEFAQAVLSEALIAFILVLAIMAVAVDPRAPKGWSGLVIGLALAAGILVTYTATDGSGNLARSLGPFVASWFYDAKNIPWSDLGVYALGPVIGGSAAAMIYELVSGLEVAAPAPHPGAATGSHEDANVDEEQVSPRETFEDQDVDTVAPAPDDLGERF